jgi:RNA polymerase sigma-70 factor (ECF subfamily)
LRSALSHDYESLTRRLTRCLGSSDLAREALHETFLRVEHVSDGVSLVSPADYLFRTAINVAKDKRKREGRPLSESEVASIGSVADDRPDPSAIAESRFELKELEKALAELPQRRRAVFIAAHVEQLSHSEIATRFGLNGRTIAFDLQYALEHLSRRLGRKVIRRFGPRQKQASDE